MLWHRNNYHPVLALVLDVEDRVIKRCVIVEYHLLMMMHGDRGTTLGVMLITLVGMEIIATIATLCV